MPSISGSTLSYMITPANVADIDMAKPLVQKLKEDYEELFKPSYYLMDAGYDKPELDQALYEKYNGQGTISIN
ncbi:transposase [Cellulosilyticum ruminicola]|uniref:transposase n=1 Tax=Cellulosilyticum ruminicola TaxID=425254 RepID=UPI0009F918AF|nr:transposase [Cellulosilyticum ruminicola]